VPSARNRDAAMTLLLVEDEERFVSFLVIALEAHGYVVACASTGGEALARLRVEMPDLIMLDLALPDMDGLDLLRRLRDEGSRVPVIILSARAGARDIVAGLESGADDYITKPFSLRELLARIQARLRPPDDGWLTV
jgi:DNA-binding response OmpR family regulator